MTEMKINTHNKDELYPTLNSYFDPNSYLNWCIVHCCLPFSLFSNAKHTEKTQRIAKSSRHFANCLAFFAIHHRFYWTPNNTLSDTIKAEKKQFAKHIIANSILKTIKWTNVTSTSNFQTGQRRPKVPWPLFSILFPWSKLLLLFAGGRIQSAARHHLLEVLLQLPAAEHRYDKPAAKFPVL